MRWLSAERGEVSGRCAMRERPI